MVSSFPKVRAIAVGKIKKAWIRDGLEVYLKRLPELEIVEIKDADPVQEGQRILSLIRPNEILIVLTEEGKTLSSTNFAEFISKENSHTLVFAIGGAEGLSLELKQRAAQRLSLSPMTFPHEIARLLLAEQLYRAKTILQNTGYHK